MTCTIMSNFYLHYLLYIILRARCIGKLHLYVFVNIETNPCSLLWIVSLCIFNREDSLYKIRNPKLNVFFV